MKTGPITLCVAALLVATVAGCAVRNAYLDPGKPHHTETGFRNTHVGAVEKPFADLVRWRYEALRDGRPPPPSAPTPRVEPDVKRVQANARAGDAMEPLVTWIGHATVLVQAGGLSVLTDPHFSARASPVSFVGPRRAQAPGMAIDDLPPIDAVVISHNHYDHLDRDSVVLLNARADGRTRFLVPLGLKPWFERHGITNVVELDWWQSHTLALPGRAPVQLHLTPVQHWSARGLHDRSQTLWGGWAVFTRDFAWYFAGDAGYSADFADTRRHFERTQAGRFGPGRGFDLALIPVGAYEPRWFMSLQHVNPQEAVQVHRDLAARHSLGIHWGTFELTDEPLDQPPKDLADARRAAGIGADTFFLLAIGESRALPRRP